MTSERVNADVETRPVNAAAPNRATVRGGLDDPRALDILTTEHWSLLSTRALGYQEILTRTTIFVAVLSATVVALALLAQATRFGRETLLVALLLIAVDLFLGVATFVRSVAINCEDARWVTGMNLLRGAYLEIVPDLARYFVTAHDSRAGRKALGHGVHQRVSNLGNSLTTTAGAVAMLNSLLVGSLASDIGALFGLAMGWSVALGAVTSVASGVAHVIYAARVRRRYHEAASEKGVNPGPG